MKLFMFVAVDEMIMPRTMNAAPVMATQRRPMRSDKDPTNGQIAARASRLARAWPKSARSRSIAESGHRQTKSTCRRPQCQRRHRLEYRLNKVSFSSLWTLCHYEKRTEDVERDLGASPEKGHGNKRHDPLG